MMLKGSSNDLDFENKTM